MYFKSYWIIPLPLLAIAFLIGFLSESRNKGEACGWDLQCKNEGNVNYKCVPESAPSLYSKARNAPKVCSKPQTLGKYCLEHEDCANGLWCAGDEWTCVPRSNEYPFLK
jgi:hypothetical protein